MATILIVDDQSANRKFLATILGHEGHRLIEAADGDAGLTAARAEHPDLVITDVLMPVMDGYELVRQLRLDPATNRIPVVFSTAYYGEREARNLALSSGVCDVLTKPAATQDVLNIVFRALSGAPATLPSDAPPLTAVFDREHLRLVTDKLSEKTEDLRTSNARLRALINIGLELASERDADQLLQRVCAAARDLFGATYITLGIVDLHDRTVQRIVTCGSDVSEWIKTGESVSGILGSVITERRTLRGINPSADSAGLQFPSLHPEVQAFVAAPLSSPEQVYGWLCLVGNEGRPFTENDEHLVIALAGLVGRIYETGHFAAIAEKRSAQLEHEILERENAKAELRQERDRAQRYLDASEVILLALDANGRITLLNRSGCALLGWAENELIGRDFIETCLPERTRVDVRAKFLRLLTGDLAIVESPILTKSGGERLIEWRNRLVRDDEGHVIGTFSSGTDITERNQAVEALRVAEERMRFTLTAAGVGIWDRDFASGVLRWSEILEAQHGLQPGTFGGTIDALVERVDPQDRDALLATMAAADRTGGDFSLHYRTIWPDGTVRWLDGVGRVLFGEHGEPVRAVGISLDVTGRRSLEEQYQQAQKMEAIGRLAGGVAHDFNNLLTAILGYCELLLSDVAVNDPVRPDILEIQKAGTSAAGLTRQLLAFSRKQIIEPTVLDLNTVVRDMRTMLGRLIGEDVNIVLRLGTELAAVRADRGQIEQIVMNLAVNARDAMPKGGKLTIETANLDLDENYPKTHLSITPGPYVSLTVTDTGTGMTPQVQARLFEPFFTTKELGKGTGLGLATVHGIVMRSGGSINVYSEIGRGTSFKVYFPKADSADIVETPAPQAAPRPYADGLTVLVVDDAEGLRELAQRLLERQGYSVLVAANAEEALQLFETHPNIDVLLTDVVMPGASGPELTKQLVLQRPALKVIYMSGYTEDAIVQHGVLKPGIAFIQKPFTFATLGRKIHEVLAS